MSERVDEFRFPCVMIMMEGKKKRFVANHLSTCFAQQYYQKKWLTQFFIRTNNVYSEDELFTLLADIKANFEKHGKMLSMAFLEFGFAVKNNGEEIIVYTK